MAHCGLDDVLDCWGEWRLSHEERMGCLRTYLTAMGAAIGAKAEEGDIVEGKSTAKGLAGTPRGVVNAREPRDFNDVRDDAMNAAFDAMGRAERLEERLDAACVTLRATVQIPRPGEDNTTHVYRVADRGPLGGELSPCDADLVAQNILTVLSQEHAGQAAFFQECVRVQSTSISGMRPIHRLEARLAVLEQQPFVKMEDFEDVATRVHVSEQLAEKRKADEAAATPKRRARRKHKDKAAARAPATPEPDDDDDDAATVDAPPTPPTPAATADAPPTPPTPPAADVSAPT